MHRIADGRTGMNRTDLFGKAAGIFSLDRVTIDVQVAMGEAFKLLDDTGRIQQEDDTSLVNPIGGVSV